MYLFTGLIFTTNAQSPARFNYQAVARNTSGNLIVNQNISVRVSILTGSATGSSEYTETHSVTTDAYGVFNLLVGGGSAVSGSFAGITWGSASKFLKIEADVTGGTTYQSIATTQILSVPYALYAEKAGNSVWSDASDHIYANNVTTTSSVAVSDKGFLGIGTKNPLGEIHVNKPIGYTGATFTGTGVNDLSVNYGNFNGSGDVTYIVEVLNSGPNPDLIRWTDNGGSTWTSNINMQTSGIALSNGTTIGFAAVDGHTYGDKWLFTVTQGFMNGFIVKDGKVGISTTSPAEKLDVVGTVKATAFIGNGAGLTGIASGTGGVVNTGTTTIGADSDGDGVGLIDLQTKGTSKVTINNNGNVGIGITNPLTKLDVAGSINSSSPDDITDITLNIKGKNGVINESAYNDIQNASPMISLNRSRGKISAPLSVISDDLLGSIEVNGYDGTGFNLSSSIKFIGESAPKPNSVPARITFNTRETNNTSGPIERMVITGAGKVGIGKVSPTEMLDVNGNVKAVSFIGNGAGLTGIASGTGGVVNTGSTTIGADSNSDGTGEIALQTKNTTRVIITNDGFIGVGTNVPGGILQVNDPTIPEPEGTLVFKDGNLGVGTLNPSNKVEINGTLKATSLEGDGSNIAGIVYTGEVRMFAISLTGSITKTTLNSKGWAVCDGSTATSQGITGAIIENTPDLRNRFIRMSSNVTSGASGGSDQINVGHYHDMVPSGSGPSGKIIGGNTSNLYFQTYTASSSVVFDNRPSYYELAFFIKVR